jgi:hypothetical protein
MRAFACLLLSVSTLAAAEPADPLLRRADVRYVNAPLRTVLSQVADAAELTMRPPADRASAEAAVGFAAKDVTLGSVLGWALRGKGLTLVPDADGKALAVRRSADLTPDERSRAERFAARRAEASAAVWVPGLRRTLDRPVTVRLRQATVAAAVEAVAAAAPANYRVAPEVLAGQRLVDADASDRPAGEVLADIARQTGARLRLLDEVVYLAPADGADEGFDWRPPAAAPPDTTTPPVRPNPVPAPARTEDARPAEMPARPDLASAAPPAPSAKPDAISRPPVPEPSRPEAVPPASADPAARLDLAATERSVREVLELAAARAGAELAFADAETMQRLTALRSRTTAADARAADVFEFLSAVHGFAWRREAGRFVVGR